ncbi:hypothetical protein APED_06600 [Acanthopleuribacter pedis]
MGPFLFVDPWWMGFDGVGWGVRSFLKPAIDAGGAASIPRCFGICLFLRMAGWVQDGDECLPAWWGRSRIRMDGSRCGPTRISHKEFCRGASHAITRGRPSALLNRAILDIALLRRRVGPAPFALGRNFRTHKAFSFSRRILVRNAGNVDKSDGARRGGVFGGRQRALVRGTKRRLP